MPELWRSTSGLYRERGHEALPLRPLEHPFVHQFQRAIESLTTAQSPDSTRHYRGVARNFLIYLGDDHPSVCSLNQLHRDPHILGWFAHLRSHTPPLAQAVYVYHLVFLRSILEELARTAQLPDLGHLIRREDLPRIPQRLPRPLTAEQDRLLQQELLRRNDLPANVFLLLRHTGMRIGECADLSYNCLHQVGPDRWAIHVPLGKLKTERMVPVDSFVCELVQRLRFFRSFDPLPADGRLLARHRGKPTLIKQLRPYLSACAFGAWARLKARPAPLLTVAALYESVAQSRDRKGAGRRFTCSNFRSTAFITLVTRRVMGRPGGLPHIIHTAARRSGRSSSRAARARRSRLLRRRPGPAESRRRSPRPRA